MGFTRCTLGCQQRHFSTCETHIFGVCKKLMKIRHPSRKMIIVHQAAKCIQANFGRTSYYCCVTASIAPLFSPVTWLPSRAGRHAGIQGCLSGRWSTKILASFPFCEANWDQPLKIKAYLEESMVNFATICQT